MMYLVWKILGTLGRYVENESIPLKIIFISVFASSSGTSANPCFPLRRAYLLLLSPTLHKSHGDLHPSFLHFILWQAKYVGKILVYMANWM